MKKFYRSFFLYFFMIAAVIFACICGVVYRQSYNASMQGLNEILDLVEKKYIQEQNDYQEKLKLIEKDYLNRAESIAYILYHNKETRTSNELIRLKGLMNVDKINVVNENGEIVYSADPAAVGTKLQNHPDAEDLMKLAMGETKDSAIVNIGVVDKEGKRIADHVAVRLDGPLYGAIEITFYSDDVDAAIEECGIENTIRSFLTEYDTTVAVFDKDGNKMAMTENNTQRLRVQGIRNVDEMQRFLEKKALNGCAARINGGWGHALSRVYDDYDLCAFYDLSEQLRAYKANMVGLVILFVFTAVAVFILLKRLFDKHLIADLHNMQEDIDAFMRGEADREIRKSENTELEHLNRSIRMLKESYRHKSERLNKIVGGLTTNIAAFECLEYTNSVFLSDNMQSVLGASDAEMAKFRSSLKDFDSFMSVLEIRKNEEGVVFFNGKWLRISSYRMRFEYFGLIVDETEEYMKRQSTLDELDQVRQESLRDKLTGLYGRAGFEKMINKLIEQEETPDGVLLMFDMDNFKSINDTLGHPEGDRALRIMGSCLTREFRKSDIVGRLGGDEFVVFIPNAIPRTNLEQKLSSLMDVAREDLSMYSHLHVTVSIGAVFASVELDDYKKLYEGADTALYIAKKLGKNQYYINDEGIRCMEKACRHCRKECPRRRILGLE